GYIDEGQTFFVKLGLPVVFLILGTEFFAPFLLMGKRSWLIGLIVAACFHLSTHMRNFSSLTFATYVLFIPKEIFESFIQKIEILCLKLTRYKFGLRSFLVFQAIGFTIFHILESEQFVSMKTYNVVTQLWVLAMLLGLGYFSYVALSNYRPLVLNWKLKSPIYIGLVLLFSLNAFSP